MALASSWGTSSSTLMDPSVEMTTLGNMLVSLVSQSLVTNALPNVAGTGRREHRSRWHMKFQLVIRKFTNRKNCNKCLLTHRAVVPPYMSHHRCTAGR